MSYQYLEHIDSALRNNALYTKHKNWERWIIYELRGAKLAKMLESLPASDTAAVGIRKPKPLIGLL